MRSRKQQIRMDAKARRRWYLGLRDRMRAPRHENDFARLNAAFAYLYRVPMVHSLLAGRPLFVGAQFEAPERRV
jgi:hypothetical protein